MKSQMGYLDVVGKLVKGGPNCQRFIFCSLRFGGQTIIRLVAGLPGSPIVRTVFRETEILKN